MPLTKRLLFKMNEAGEPLGNEVSSPLKLTIAVTAPVEKTAFASAAAQPASRHPPSMTTEEEVRPFHFTPASPHVFQTTKNRSSAPLESNTKSLSPPSRPPQTALKPLYSLDVFQTTVQPSDHA